MELELKLTIVFLVTIIAAVPSIRKPIIYVRNHEIVDMATPFVEPNDKIDQQYLMEHEAYVFFVEADLKDNGDKDYKGLYILKEKEAKIILENGQSVTYANDYNAYFGAKDGIYKYNEKNDTAEKVRNVNESVTKMATDTKGGLIYYLTEDHVLYQFDKDESTKVEAVKDARDIVFDLNGNLFYYDGTKQVYVFDGENVLKIEGLPSDLKKVDFFKNPFGMQGVYAIVDSAMYKVNKDGTSVKSTVEFQAPPTAYALDYGVFQFYAYNKKIYRCFFNILDQMAIAESQN